MATGNLNYTNSRKLISYCGETVTVYYGGSNWLLEVFISIIFLKVG